MRELSELKEIYGVLHNDDLKNKLGLIYKKTAAEGGDYYLVEDKKFSTLFEAANYAHDGTTYTDAELVEQRKQKIKEKILGTSAFLVVSGFFIGITFLFFDFVFDVSGDRAERKEQKLIEQIKSNPISERDIQSAFYEAQRCEDYDVCHKVLSFGNRVLDEKKYGDADLNIRVKNMGVKSASQYSYIMLTYYRKFGNRY
ncbi:MAG: hypothetical protein K9L82_10590 [Chromatiaceae bacterium]|nr:hypothetical protein [Chromatiaceae bacterium]